MMLASFSIVFGSVSALHPTHNNPLVYPYSTFAIIFNLELQFSYLVT